MTWGDMCSRCSAVGNTEGKVIRFHSHTDTEPCGVEVSHKTLCLFSLPALQLKCVGWVNDDVLNTGQVGTAACCGVKRCIYNSLTESDVSPGCSDFQEIIAPTQEIVPHISRDKTG